MTASAAPIATGPLPAPSSRKVHVNLDCAVLASEASCEGYAEASPSRSGWLSPSERHFNPGDGFQSPTTAYFEQPSFCVAGAGVPFFAPAVALSLGALPQAFGPMVSESLQPAAPASQGPPSVAAVSAVGPNLSLQAVGWWAAPQAVASTGAPPVQPVMALVPGTAQPTEMVAVASGRGLVGDATGPMVSSGCGYGALAVAPAAQPTAVKAGVLPAVSQRGEWRLPMQPHGSSTGAAQGPVPEAVYVDLSSLRERS